MELMTDDPKWEKTDEALAKLLIDFKCKICNSLANDPIKYGMCNHCFCRKCVDAGSCICPSCGILSRASEVTTDKITRTLIHGWKSVACLVNAKRFNVDPNFYINASNKTTKSEDGLQKLEKQQSKHVLPKKGKIVEEKSKFINKEKADTKTDEKATSKKRKLEVNVPGNKIEVKVSGNKEEKKQEVNISVNKKEKPLKKNTQSKTDTPVVSKPSNKKSKLVQEMKEKISETIQKKDSGSKQMAATDSVSVNETLVGSGFETPNQSISHALKSKTPKCQTPSKELMKRNKKGETALHVACIKGNLSLIRSLLAAGANPNTKDNAGYTPLHEAVSQGFTEVVELLLDAGALVDVPGVDNMTALHEAVLSGRTEIVKMLVSRGASPTARTSFGKTVKELATTPELMNALETPVLNDLLTTRKATNVLAVENVLCFQGLDKKSMKDLTSIATNLGLRVVQKFSQEVTHLIVATDKNNVCPVSVEVLSAILCGCWILNRDWLSLSQESGEAVDPTLFEIYGMVDYVAAVGPKRGRLNAWKQLPGLFNGCHFYVLPSADLKLGDCLISRKDLMSLIQNGGGVILSREPRAEDIPEREKTVPYHADLASDLKFMSHIILYGKAKAPKLKYNMLHIKSLPAEWLVGCIANWKLMDPPLG